MTVVRPTRLQDVPLRFRVGAHPAQIASGEVLINPTLSPTHSREPEQPLNAPVGVRRVIKVGSL